MKTIMKCLSIWLLVAASNTQAVEIVVSREQMLFAMQPFFPYPLVVGGWQISLTEPNLVLSSNDQMITLEVLMDVTSGVEKMQLAGSINGQAAFDASTQKLQLINPKMESLKVLSGHISNAQASLDTLRRSVGQELPIIVLLDLKQLGLSMFKPSRIHIVDNGIAINL